jgi:hypothetical protein
MGKSKGKNPGSKVSAIAKPISRPPSKKPLQAKKAPKESTDSSMEGSTSKACKASKVKGGANVASEKGAAASAKGSGNSESKAAQKALTKSNLDQLRGNNVPEEDINLINPAKVEKGLNQHVKSLAQAVNRDWHDSYEETGEELCRYMEECLEIVEMAVNLAMEHGVAFDWCHQVLMTIADTWDNIKAIPFRSAPDEFPLNPGRNYLRFFFVETDEGPTDFDAPSDIDTLLQIAWPTLLASAADPELEPDIISDGELLQMIKDAVDNGVAPLEITSAARGVGEDYVEYIKRGYDRIRKLYGKTSAWKSLPSSKREHAMRDCIDRRFEGPREFRTRDYPSDEDDAFGEDSWGESDDDAF